MTGHFMLKLDQNVKQGFCQMSLSLKFFFSSNRSSLLITHKEMAVKQQAFNPHAENSFSFNVAMTGNLNICCIYLLMLIEALLGIVFSTMSAM